MPVTPETVARHELVGLEIRIRSASNPDLIGLSGECVLETTQMLGIESEGCVRHVPKEAATFDVTLPSGEVVEIDGTVLLGQPARRTEYRGDSKWR